MNVMVKIPKILFFSQHKKLTLKNIRSANCYGLNFCHFLHACTIYASAEIQASDDCLKLLERQQNS